MSTLSTTFPLDGTISHERAVSGSVNSIGRLSGNLNRNGIIEAAVEVFHFTVAPNNRVTFTDVTNDRLSAAIANRKTVLALLFKQNASIEEYKTLELVYYDASGKYIFNTDHDGITYKISTINGGVIWEYSVLRTDGENLLGLETSSKGSLVSAINEINGKSSLPSGGEQGDIMIKRSAANGDAEWLPPANSAEQDNTRPITAAAVYTEIGNINALLATI